MSIPQQKIAFIFPGQGSQSIGMLASLIKTHTEIQLLFEQASEYVGCNLLALMQQGPMQMLNQTVYTQPLLLTASVALWQLWKQHGGLSPDFLLGHSLGEYSAYVCADSLAFLDTVELVVKRATYMQEAVNGIESGMGVIVGLSEDEVTEICSYHNTSDWVAPTIYNTRDQIVIGGHLSSVKQAMERAKAKGARLAQLLPMSVPAHSALMKPAVQPLTLALEAVSCHLPSIPVISNHHSKPLKSIQAIQQSLIAHLYQPIRWLDNVKFLLHQGVNCFVECGPNRVLTQLVRNITNHSVRVISLGDVQSFEKALSELV